MAPNARSKTFIWIFCFFNLSALILAQGTQFITGACSSDADCASACCGFNSGKCAGPVVAQERDGGCGFGNAQPNDDAARALTGGQPTATSSAKTPASAGTTAATATATATTAARGGSTSINTNIPGSANVGNGAGKQFITGQCLSDADCASGCCGFNTGLCAGAVIAQTRDGGCGFGDAQPNDTAAKALDGGTGTDGDSSTSSSNIVPTTTQAASGAIDSSLAGSANVGKGAGTQFITGQCFSDADCASGCCGFNTGKCAGAVIAQTRDGGCGFGDATPNDTAAQALTKRAATLGRRRVRVREFLA